MKAAKDRMKKLDKRDSDKVKTDKAKNDFESIIYSFREWINEDANFGFIEMGGIERITMWLASEEEWLLDGEGDYASYLDYMDKLHDLSFNYTKLKSRKNEYMVRDETIKMARAILDDIQKKVLDLEVKKPWIKEEKKKDVIEKLNDASEWLDDMISQQTKVALHEDPVFKAQDVENKIKRVDTLYTKVAAASKPKESKLNKNIKIDNITIDGNSGDVNWEDFIKINNGPDTN